MIDLLRRFFVNRNIRHGYFPEELKKVNYHQKKISILLLREGASKKFKDHWFLDKGRMP